MSLSTTERLRLYREAADLTIDAMDATEQRERERLLAEAKRLTDRAEAGDAAADLQAQEEARQRPAG